MCNQLFVNSCNTYNCLFCFDYSTLQDIVPLNYFRHNFISSSVFKLQNDFCVKNMAPNRTVGVAFNNNFNGSVLHEAEPRNNYQVTPGFVQ